MATQANIEPSSGPSYPWALPDQEAIQTMDDEDCDFEGLCLPPCFDSDDDSDDESVGKSDEKKSTASNATSTPGDVACAWVLCDTLWSEDTLKVYFLNKVPEEWQYDGKPITPELIVGWAREAWKMKPDDHSKEDPIPQFEITRRVDRADIRVKFSCEKTCWSMLGSRAKDIKNEKKPTMVLNLGFRKNKKPVTTTEVKAHDQRVKSLVIHEFGHALGLQHEHQRSDFWDIMEKHLDLERMKDDKRVEKSIKKAGAATCGADWFEKPEGLLKAIRTVFGVKDKEETDGPESKSDYDPKSIMHYGFDKHWIKNEEYRDVRKLMDKKSLPESEREYLIGVLNTNGKLAEKPSDTDIDYLAKAYVAFRANCK